MRSSETQNRYDRLQVYSLSMYGGSSKLGRNGGGGAARGIGAKRPNSSHPLPPPHRQSGQAGAGRLSIGGRVSGSASNPRSRGSIQSAAPAAVEENFSLVPGNNPPAFAMIIRLAPDLVNDIKRLEAQAGTARIKFDVTASNSSGNVSFLLKFQLGSVYLVMLVADFAYGLLSLCFYLLIFSRASVKFLKFAFK